VFSIRATCRQIDNALFGSLGHATCVLDQITEHGLCIIVSGVCRLPELLERIVFAFEGTIYSLERLLERSLTKPYARKLATPDEIWVGKYELRRRLVHAILVAKDVDDDLNLEEPRWPWIMEDENCRDWCLREVGRLKSEQ